MSLTVPVTDWRWSASARFGAAGMPTQIRSGRIMATAPGRRLDIGFELETGIYEDVGLAYKIRHEARRRPVIERLRRIGLLDPPGAHDEDAIRQGERLLLIVSDADGGDAELFVQALHFHLQLLEGCGPSAPSGSSSKSNGGSAISRVQAPRAVAGRHSIETACVHRIL